MINLFCDKCKDKKDSMIQLRTEQASIVLECLTCGDMKRFSNPKQGGKKK